MDKPTRFFSTKENTATWHVIDADGKTLGRPVILQVEDVATLPLDYLAVEEGYTAGFEDCLCRR